MKKRCICCGAKKLHPSSDKYCVQCCNMRGYELLAGDEKGNMIEIPEGTCKLHRKS